MSNQGHTHVDKSPASRSSNMGNQVFSEGNNQQKELRKSSNSDHSISMASNSENNPMLLMQPNANVNSDIDLSSTFSNKIENATGSGISLSEEQKSEYEGLFQTDLGSIKIHDDPQAHDFAINLNAQAFTVGNDIFFGKEKYNPNTTEGKSLLAHEITHTIQQSPLNGKPSVARKIQRLPIEEITEGDEYRIVLKDRDAVINGRINHLMLHQLPQWSIENDQGKMVRGIIYHNTQIRITKIVGNWCWVEGLGEMNYGEGEIPVQGYVHCRFIDHLENPNTENVIPEEVEESNEPVESLEDRAVREAGEGSSELQIALNNSLSTVLPFEFSTHLKGNKKIPVSAGSSITIIVNGDVEASDIQGNGLYNISLLNDGSQEGYTINFQMQEGDLMTTWDQLNGGSYQLDFNGNEDNNSTFIGEVTISVVSGGGVVEDGRGDKEEFEREFSVPLNGESQGIAATAYGQFVLRSQPISSSFIYGTLPGVPVQVEVLDKVSFDANDVSGEKTYYLIQFAENGEWERNTINEPGADFIDAFEGFQRQEAWVTGQCLKIFIPYDEFMVRIRNFEARDEIRNLNLSEKIRILRQLYTDPDLVADEILDTPTGARDISDRTELSNVLHLLKGPVTGIEFPDGEKIDIGHVVLGLDALQLPDGSYSYYGIDAGNKHAFLTWSGDTGAAAADYVKDHVKRGLDEIDEDLVQFHFDKSAPDSDLLGDIDAFGTLLLMNAENPPTTVEQLMVEYYGGTVDKNEITLTVNRAAAIRNIGIRYGFTEMDNLNDQDNGVEAVLDETYRFSRLWYYRSDYWDDQDDLLMESSRLITSIFLDRMEEFAREFGATDE